MNAADRLFAFILENAAREPLARRAALYRDAAELLTEKHGSVLVRMANDLEAIEQQHRQLLLNINAPDA